MKYFRSAVFILISFSFLFLIGCEEQVLNKEPQQSFSEKDIWSDIDLVKRYVWNNYNSLGDRSINQSVGYLTLPASLTDDAFIIFNKYGAASTNKGILTQDNMGAWADTWEDKYEGIRNVNIFFDRIDEVKADADLKKRLKGEMKFIRAWNYARLINFFGGVPLIEKAFKLNEDFKTERNSYQECVKWIVKELDEAKDMIPKMVPSNEFGRVNKGAVLALKARLLLYSASKLHDPDTKPSGPLYDYDKANKWKDAADAAKAVMDLNLYSLVQVDDWKDYQQMFLRNTSEIIFARTYNSQYRQGIPNIDKVNSPNGYNGWGGNCPTQNLVDAFQMKDGKSIEASPLYNSTPNSIYKNRELRFYADIVYQGANYRGRETEFYLPGGKDSRDGVEPWNYAVTGYTMRKYMDESIEFKKSHPTTPQIYFRLAEIYLNYAEAQYHFGNEGVARKYVNKIRKRVHLPDINSSGQELLKDIQHERRIELVFEAYHRYNDLRRWMLAEKELSKNAKGLAWQKVNDQGEAAVGGKLTYEIVNAQERSFKKRMYYLPIPRSETQKTNLQQNWGYK